MNGDDGLLDWNEGAIKYNIYSYFHGNLSQNWWPFVFQGSKGVNGICKLHWVELDRLLFKLHLWKLGKGSRWRQWWFRAILITPRDQKDEWNGICSGMGFSKSFVVVFDLLGLTWELNSIAQRVFTLPIRSEQWNCLLASPYHCKAETPLLCYFNCSTASVSIDVQLTFQQRQGVY